MQRLVLRGLLIVLVLGIVFFLINYRVALLGGDGGVGFSISPRGTESPGGTGNQAQAVGEPSLEERGDADGVSCVVELVDQAAVGVRLHVDEGGVYFAVHRPKPEEMAARDPKSLTILQKSWLKVSFDTILDRRRALALLVYLGLDFLAPPGEGAEPAPVLP